MRNVVLIVMASFLFSQQSIAKELPRYYLSVDMEGIGGVGTFDMVLRGKYGFETSREYMTAEVNAVVEAILKKGPAEIVINDAHGYHQNIIQEQLDPKVIYIMGDDKPFGMMEGLDETFDAAFFIGYHARFGSKGFLAHTGTLRIVKIALNGIEVGEGGLNAAYAGALGVPVILASGDQYLSKELSELFPLETVITKEAISWDAAKLKHPAAVRKELNEGVSKALKSISTATPWELEAPIRFEITFSRPIYGDIFDMIPGIERVNGLTIAYTSKDMKEAYEFIRFIYKYVAPEE